jgi:Zn-dependent peptidase ImmA (M78 family)
MEGLAHLEGCVCITWPFIPPIREVKCGRWIGLAAGLSVVENRFLIAHALAHHLMHCGNQLTFYGCLEWRRQEIEADCCAAHILIPEDEIIKIDMLPPWEIAEHFGVPEELGFKRIALYATMAEMERWRRS